MKKTLFLFFVLYSCVSYGQWPWEKIDGNGHIIKETRKVSGYTGVSSSGSWDVMIAYGESDAIQVEGDENLLPYIETTVKDGQLEIRSRKNANLRSKKKITVYVSLTRMTAIHLSGSGDIMGEGKFENPGTTVFRVSGSGSIRINLHKIGKAEIGVSGSGNVRVSGSAASVSARISGSGNADCSSLICDDAHAQISGSGNIKLNANKSVEAQISGSGNVTYTGAASDIKKHVSGSGRVVKG